MMILSVPFPRYFWLRQVKPELCGVWSGYGRPASGKVGYSQQIPQKMNHSYTALAKSKKQVLGEGR